MEAAVFWLFAVLAAGSALVVVVHRNPVYSLMAMVLTLFSVAVLFVLLGAPFIAALQVLIYAGAILVLFLFVIMLLNLQREDAPATGQAAQRWGAIAGAGLFGGMLVTLFWRTYAEAAAPPLSERLVSLHALASGLFTVYLLPFEMVGLLLLVAVTAATVVARKGDR
jgi:NADH-quinone oxidoreductase subunit J